MNRLRGFLLLLATQLAAHFNSSAQERPIGYWKSFLPYNNAIGVATSGSKLFVASTQGFYTFDVVAGQLDAFSKVEGMSDIGMQCVGYDLATSTAILAYSNGNIDLFKDNTFYNIPELKIKTIAGAKTISSIYTRNGIAYLSTSIGIIVLDLSKQTIKETYEFSLNNKSVPVRGVAIKSDSILAITPAGIYRADINSASLQNYQSWNRIDTNGWYKFIVGTSESIFVANDTAVFRFGGAVKNLVYRSPSVIDHLDATETNVFVAEYDTANYNGQVSTLDAGGALTDSVGMPGKHPLQVVKNGDGTLWIAEEFGGLLRCNQQKELGYFTPRGPSNFNTFDIDAYNGDLWIAHGGYTSGFRGFGRFNAFSRYNEDKWEYLERYIYRPFDTLVDFCNLEIDQKTGVKYMGSIQSGLFVQNPDGTYQLYNVNSILEGSINIGPNERQIIGMKLDERGNLWMTLLNNSGNQLYVRTPEDQWYKFRVDKMTFGGPMLVDDENRVWFVGPNGGGVGVYSFGSYETLGDKSDDAQYSLKAGVGFGNLPSNSVNCLAKDRNNNIWVGTTEGIGIVNNCSVPASTGAPCDADIPIVQYDQFAGYLFAGNNVRAIAVDGANRKWVGTDDGVWLLSPDASKIVNRFTVENSPLPSNSIVTIAIDQQTGEVYFGTEAGLVSYKGAATEGGSSNKEVICYPNPVPSGYSGTIAVRGLVENADVRITDISGQLVYRTRALGGQAVWNGLDYTGRKPQSGVYMVFASDANGTETYSGKLVFLK